MAIIWVGTGRFNAYSGPVQDYIDRVVAADVATGNTLGLEVGVRDAYDVFIRDSINVGHLGTSGGVLSQANSIIKASPIMAGARTLQGCLVPLVGTAPTRFGTESGWNYNRKTGLQADGSSNYLGSNRNNNDDPQNSFHMSFFASVASTANAVYMGVGPTTAETGVSNIGRSSSTTFHRNRASTALGPAVAALPLGFGGTARSASTTVTLRVAGISNTNNNFTSQAPRNELISIFACGTSATFKANARLSFYSIGESLDLALLDARVTALINAIAAAIP